MNPDNEDAQEILRQKRITEFFARSGIPDSAQGTIRCQLGHVAQIVDVDETHIHAVIVEGMAGDSMRVPGSKVLIPHSRFLPKYISQQGQG